MISRNVLRNFSYVWDTYSVLYNTKLRISIIQFIKALLNGFWNSTFLNRSSIS